MNAKLRSQTILGLIEKKGKVTVSELSIVLAVSEMTVRRDLEELEREGALRRIHGGALSIVSTSFEPAFAIRSQTNIEAKTRIGAKAASLLAEAETILLDVGTTAMEVARALRGRRNLTVLTPSLRAAALLAEEPGLTLIVSGGLVRFGEQSMIGDLVTHSFSELLFDTYIMAAGAVHADLGVTEYNMDDANVKRSALQAARRLILVADSSKLGKVAFARVCPISSVDILITDNGSPQELEPFRSQDIELIAV